MPKNLKPLSANFFRRPTTEVAKELLGALLVRRWKQQIWACRIVETEAYLGINDPACHSFGGKRTTRTETMYLPGGYSYIYFIYGMHYCFNVVTSTENHPEAVLIRAIEPLVHWDHSGSHPFDHPRNKSKLPTNGPGKICRFLGIDKNLNAIPLWTRDYGLWISPPLEPISATVIQSAPRIGIEYAREARHWPLRFFIRNHPYVSSP